MLHPNVSRIHNGKAATTPSKGNIYLIFHKINSEKSLQFHGTDIFYLYDKLSKGVSIVSNQLPYSLKLVKSYPIISNSKAA